MRPSLPYVGDPNSSKMRKMNTHSSTIIEKRAILNSPYLLDCQTSLHSAFSKFRSLFISLIIKSTVQMRGHSSIFLDECNWQVTAVILKTLTSALISLLTSPSTRELISPLTLTLIISSTRTSISASYITNKRRGQTFMSSKQFRAPPNPASASATIGAYQSRCAR